MLAAILAVAVPVDAGSGDSEREPVVLPNPDTTGSMTVEQALARRRSVRSYESATLSMVEVGQLLWAAQGETQPRTGYRTAPSAGATFPLELYLVAGRVDGLPPGLYRYRPRHHELEMVSSRDMRNALHSAALRQPMILHAPIVLVITSVTERTAARYGERAVRYVAMEAGHASQNVYLQAIALGLGTVAVGAFDDQEIARVLGLPDGEQPLYLMPVGLTH